FGGPNNVGTNDIRSDAQLDHRRSRPGLRDADRPADRHRDLSNAPKRTRGARHSRSIRIGRARAAHPPSRPANLALGSAMNAPPFRRLSSRISIAYSAAVSSSPATSR